MMIESENSRTNLKTLSELIEKRKKWAESSKQNRFNFEEILAGSYNDTSHFIYELLQNAEDEGAKEARFELFRDRIDFYHNGKDFDLNDIEGVTGIGISKKKDDLNSIGKFGVGFKSVFAITETPHIFSGKYRIKIKDLVVPTLIDNYNEKISGTLISLPFNHKSRSPEEIFELTLKRLENLGLKTMLFLKNIEEIQWKAPSKSGHYLKETFQIGSNVRKVTVISSTTTEEYIIIERPIEIEGKTLEVEVAYKLGENKSGREIIVPDPDSKLVVYFPTEKITYLHFIIQGPYKTTPNRENIPFTDEQNIKILKETARLVADSLEIIKELGYLDINFLNILPIKNEYKEKELIYSIIYDKIKEKLLTDALLPSHDNQYVKANEALLARGKELTEFLNSDDIAFLYKRRHWLDTDITQDKAPELRDYLIKELNIPEIDFERFVRKIDIEFLKRKSDDWMVKFYTKLLDMPALWIDSQRGILRRKPILRLENGEHISPYDNNGKVQVYLPCNEKSRYRTVKQNIIRDEKALKFLKELGLKKPGLFAEIKEFIIPKYQKENPVKDYEYLEDIGKLLKAYKNLSEEGKKELIEIISSTSFVYAVKNDKGELRLRKPSEVYLKNNDLIKYFEGYQTWFVSDELYEKFGQEVNNFLLEVGAEDKPRKIEIPANLTLEEKAKLRKPYEFEWTRDIHQKDYDLEGLDNFIKNISLEKSHLLWKFLLKIIEPLNEWYVRNFFYGEYCWFYRQERRKTFESKFLKTLKKHAWLADKSNNLRKPFEITFSELSDAYMKDSPKISILKEILGFQPEIIEQLPEEDRKILELKRKYGLTPEQLEQLLQNHSETKKVSQEREESLWSPECKPEEAVMRVEDYKPEKLYVSDLTGQSENIEQKNQELLNKGQTSTENEPVASKLVSVIRATKAEAL